jgi:hypothetical protein
MRLQRTDIVNWTFPYQHLETGIYELSQNHHDLCRCRFIVHIADLSALASHPDVVVKIH